MHNHIRTSCILQPSVEGHETMTTGLESHDRIGAETASRLQEDVVAFIRAFGLLRPDATPCGRALSVSEAHALMELSRGQSLSQMALGQRLRLEKSTVSRLIDQLQNRGWVERGRDPADGRAIRLQLTEQGRHVSEQVAAARSAHFARLTARIPPGEREAVIHAFRVLVQTLDSQSADSPDMRTDDRQGA